MQIKLLEIRDRATFIPVFAISTLPANDGQRYLLRRAGYAPDSHCILLARLDGYGNIFYDPYNWGDRTMATAHHYIEQHFQNLNDGDVVDVEFILGETKEPKISERETAHV